jgi:hypothetical protein
MTLQSAIELKQIETNHLEDGMLILASGIHEAGHVLASREFGFEVEWVSLDPDFLMTNALAIKGQCSSGDPVTMTMASHILQPIADRGCVTSRDEWDLVRGYYIQSFAGPMAEDRFNRHFQKQVAERDMQQADGLLFHLMKPDKFQFRQKRKQFLRDTFEYVEANSTTIYWLGYSIYSRQTIMRDEIDAAILEARQKAVNNVYQ